MSSRPAEKETYSRQPAGDTLSGRPLLVARAAWLVLAVVVIGLNAAGIPYAYALYKETCTSVACAELGRLTPEGIRDLREVGISPEFYAAYVGVGIQVAVMLVFCAVAAVIFWRRSENRMALLASFGLLLFGGAAKWAKFDFYASKIIQGGDRAGQNDPFDYNLPKPKTGLQPGEETEGAVIFGRADPSQPLQVSFAWQHGGFMAPKPEPLVFAVTP